MANDQTPHVTRRRFLAGAAGLSAAGLLAACSSSKAPAQSASTTTAAMASGTTSASPTTAAGLPAYIPYTGVSPDIPATNQYSVGGFLRYPTSPVAAIPSPSSGGGTVTGLQYLYGAPTTSVGSNPWWQTLNKKLGVELKLQQTPVADFWTKFPTMIAGGDIPDFTTVLFSAVPGAVGGVEATFADLTEYVGGDAVKNYPMLANFPTPAWEGALVGGKLLGVPSPLLPLSNQYSARADIFDKLKVSGDVADSSEFTALCKAVTSEKDNRWAVGQAGGLGNYIQVMFGVPNNWRVEGGKFTNAIETPEYADALSYTAGLWKAGYFYPDTFTATVEALTLLTSGKICMLFGGGPGWASNTYVPALQTPGLKVALLAPPKQGGGGLAPAWLGSPTYGFTAINKKLSGDRIRAVLDVLNYTAAPFGTAEYMLVNYGVKGVDYTIDATTGSIAPTARAAQDNTHMYDYPGTTAVYFVPGYPDVVKDVCAWQAKETANVVSDPTVGLISPTFLQKTGQLNTLVTDAANDVTQGRKSVSDWKSVISQWQQAGGSQARAEYEQAYAKAHG